MPCLLNDPLLPVEVFVWGGGGGCQGGGGGCSFVGENGACVPLFTNAAFRPPFEHTNIGASSGQAVGDPQRLVGVRAAQPLPSAR